MHICFLTNEFPKEGFPHGGIGSFVKTIATALVKKGIDVSIIGINYTQNDETEIVEGVKVYRLKKSTVKGLSWYFNSKAINKKIKQIHEHHSISIVESSELGLAFISKIREIKYVIRLHGGHHFFTLFENRPRENKKVWLENRSFKKADYLVAVSEYVCQITLRELNIEKRKVSIIYNPVDTSKFMQVDYSKAKPNSILIVGSVCEKKGVRQLIEALIIVKTKIPDVSLKIVGRDWFFPDGSSYIDYLSNYIVDEIKDAITIVGAIPNTEIPRYIEQSEICVNPSHMEAMPLAWLEVLSMGKQFIGSEIGPGFEIVTNKVTGLLCNPHNSKDIADKIIWMLTHKEESITMGLTARKDILKRFDVAILVQKNIKFYNEIIN